MNSRKAYVTMVGADRAYLGMNIYSFFIKTETPESSCGGFVLREQECNSQGPGKMTIRGYKNCLPKFLFKSSDQRSVLCRGTWKQI